VFDLPHKQWATAFWLSVLTFPFRNAIVQCHKWGGRFPAHRERVLMCAVDDSSPFITYNGTWGDSYAGDPYIDSYYEHTFHPTQTTVRRHAFSCEDTRSCPAQNSSANFSFNGTGVYLYGAKRSNHGAYAVSLDGQITSGNGSSPNAELFEQLLFSAVDLPYGTHELVLTNTAAPQYLDLDSVVVVGGDGNVSTPQTATTLEDTMSAFVYGSGWASAGDSSYSGSSAQW
jgi:hypothetical protein